ncbi:HEAT repeat domain-containing protein [Microterricola viridarii]|uniref:HEAT repeat-containing protein n=1 Tax=Microterricola viridarii TaxID=412690 RepID=A0A1H1WNW0_9MICO|nr:HEAT repeat domain-containing protein [Microterricola viridarii]SDS98350.1 HEAT repeat-containing protein [Microterricola viridarii]
MERSDGWLSDADFEPRPERIDPEKDSFSADEAPILADLRAAGFEFDSVDALRESGTRSVDAIPILVGWLPRIENSRVKMSVVRALSVSWARPAANKPLVAEFIRDAPGDPFAGWLIGSALSVTADSSIVEQLVELLGTPRYGMARQMLPYALARCRDARVVPALLAALPDDQVRAQTIDALATVKAAGIRDRIEPYLEDPSSLVRRLAKKALLKLPT